MNIRNIFVGNAGVFDRRVAQYAHFADASSRPFAKRKQRLGDAEVLLGLDDVAGHAVQRIESDLPRIGGGFPRRACGEIGVAPPAGDAPCDALDGIDRIDDFKDGEFFMAKASGIALDPGAGNIFDLVQNETASALPSS